MHTDSTESGLLQVDDESPSVARARSDLASRTALAQELEAAAFFKNVLDASRDCIKVLTLDGDLVFMNEGGKAVMEVDDFETVRGCPWTGFWEGEDQVEARKALASAREGGTGHFVGAASTAKGTPKFWDVTVTRIAGAGGAPDQILSISRDITDAKRSEAQREMLSRELSHRIKNSLAVVQAIAGQTFRGLDEARLAAFQGRLAALGGAQDLLLQASWESVPIGSVVEGTLRPLCPPGRCAFEGGDVSLAPRQGLSLALALHELGTNAVKYGALSNDHGCIRAAWSVQDGELQFTWTETGGPPVQPPERTGFGTRIMTRNLEADFGGRVELNYRPGGVVLLLTAPL